MADRLVSDLFISISEESLAPQHHVPVYIGYLNCIPSISVRNFGAFFGRVVLYDLRSDAPSSWENSALPGLMPNMTTRREVSGRGKTVLLARVGSIN